MSPALGRSPGSPSEDPRCGGRRYRDLPRLQQRQEFFLEALRTASTDEEDVARVQLDEPVSVG